MHTGLSPEWDRDYDAVFAELISRDDDLVRAEFTGLTGQSRTAGRATVPVRRRGPRSRLCRVHPA
ncbi:hypothetical protein [Dactylosporangium matsuzakiense]|uniref:Uncharacterized protein n=1 Tax=Dactylosporangium matsuzakiense TaxID=53360 RepID=A0A9W6KHP5_9ACTN|nr:hypothetical protein [Dactylosporangium matsuzakiense]UWZ48754.1 hypothetical protein Dmats_21545 [Dactylosporangium matsuzakiense]GLL01147.1 hypothetical protein GCM10017581_028880 [Dactylosporangium matsuzakiense]